MFQKLFLEKKIIKLEHTSFQNSFFPQGIQSSESMI